MTQDEIISMAKKCGWDNPANNMAPLYEFAKLVAEHEREACEALCKWRTGVPQVDAAIDTCAAAIRARGQA